MEEMYKGMVNSPISTLVKDISIDDKEIEIADISVLPDAPNLVCIGLGEDTETVKYSEIEGNILKGCERGFQGTEREWRIGTVICRGITEWDIGGLQRNVEGLNNNIDKMAIKKHSSQTTEFGISTATEYGHTRVVNSLVSNNILDSLSANQGLVLNNELKILGARKYLTMIQYSSILGMSNILNANDFTETSNLFVYNLINMPSTASTYGFLETKYFDGVGFSPSSANLGNLMQTFYEWHTGISYRRVAISKKDKNWTPWIKIGGDSDTVGGKKATDFLPINNGTAIGTITTPNLYATTTLKLPSVSSNDFFGRGTGDGGTTATYNFFIRGWWSMAFQSGLSADNGKVTGLYDFRLGIFSALSGFRGLTDNTADLGTSSFRFRNTYLATSPIITSDKNNKKNIESLNNKKVHDFIMSLNPVSYEFKDDGSLRTHHGLIAQEVESAMYENNMNSLDFAGLIISPITEDIESGEYKNEEIINEDGEVTIDKVPIVKTVITGKQYGLRYEEFIAPLIKIVQMQQKELNDVKEILRQNDLVNKD
jgi:hypothetical protein